MPEASGGQTVATGRGAPDYSSPSSWS